MFMIKFDVQEQVEEVFVEEAFQFEADAERLQSEFDLRHQEYKAALLEAEF